MCPGKFFATVNGVLDYLLFLAGYDYDQYSVGDEVVFFITDVLAIGACQMTCHDCLCSPPDNTFNSQSALPKVGLPQK